MLENDGVRQRIADWFYQWGTPLRRHLTKQGKLLFNDVDDVAQEVFLRLLRYERVELITHPQAYLFKIASNVVAEWSTRASRRLLHSSELLEQLAEETDPEHEYLCADKQNQIRKAVERLPLRSREILRMRYEEGLTNDLIALKLNITRRIVKRDLIKAYSELRESLEMFVVTRAAAVNDDER